jgi:hypothetical protein
MLFEIPVVNAIEGLNTLSLAPSSARMWSSVSIVLRGAAVDTLSKSVKDQSTLTIRTYSITALYIIEAKNRYPCLFYLNLFAFVDRVAML